MPSTPTRPAKRVSLSEMIASAGQATILCIVFYFILRLSLEGFIARHLNSPLRHHSTQPDLALVSHLELTLVSASFYAFISYMLLFLFTFYLFLVQSI